MKHFPRPFAYHRRPADIIRHFTPNWFAVTMGTGVLALALNQLPGAPAAVHGVAMLLWQVNIALFTLCTLLYTARWLFYPREAALIFGHPVMPMFLGAIPMGLATIVNGLVVFVGQAGLALALWRVDAALAVIIGLAVPYCMFTQQRHSMEAMTAVWLLPIVACEVAAASAGLLIPHLAGPEALQLLIAGYVLWSLSVPLALGVLVILFLRLVLHKLPPREMAVSSWLALGPLGTGALGLLVLGRDAPAVLNPAGLADAAVAAHGLGLIGGLALWAYGAWWLLMAMAITLSYLRQGLPFNMGWWGFTFPLGVFILSTYALAPQTGLAIFTTLGVMLTALLVVFWVVVMVRTCIDGYRGHLFTSPCLLAQRQTLDGGR
jgi:C4-dicarboxylate transporter/malic acid transport protein